MEKKKLPVDSSFYDEMSYVDDDGVYVHSETKNTEQENKTTVETKTASEKGVIPDEKKPLENVSKEENIK